MTSGKNVQTKRATSGFTMMETLLAVAIVIIMGGLAFLSIFQYQKNLYQLQMDGIAREIYVAAQNHLSTAKAEGVLDSVNKGAPESDAVGNDVYYFVYGGSSDAVTYYSGRTTALACMLPFGSIDDTVRLAGSYVVRYQVNAEVARVLDVFYADPNGRYSAVFTTGDYATLLANFRGDKMREFGDGIIGWWGDEAADVLKPSADNLVAPTIEVINAERLRVRITDTGNADWGNLRLEVRGVQSGAVMSVPLRTVPTGATVSTSNATFSDNSTIAPNDFVVDLDDITGTTGYFDRSLGGPQSSHFADIAAFYKDPLSPAFIPGEDIEIQAIAGSTIKIAADMKSATIVTNSLFDTLVGPETALAGNPVAPPAGTPVAGGLVPEAAAQPTERTMALSSIRHLENLDPSISGLNIAGIVAADDTISGIDSAMQLNDLSWPRFMDAIRGVIASELPNRSGGIGTSSDGSINTQAAGLPVVVTKLGISPQATGGTGFQTVENTFMPVNPGFALTYEGNLFKVSDIVVDASGPAGMFGTLSGGGVSNVALVNFAVNTGDAGSSTPDPAGVPAQAGYAGALAGVATNLTVSDVLAYNEPATGQETGFDAALGITGSAGVGGLIGSMTGGSIDSSAAALYVRSTGDSGFAGGLVGVANEGTITRSYSGGHTVNTNTVSDTGMYNTSADVGVAGHINVYAANVAGGLVGAETGTTVQHCYSTCSAYGSTAGGLVGTANTGSIENSYALGLVRGDSAAVGAFIGSIDAGDPVPANAPASQKNYYLDYLDNNNYGDLRPAIGNDRASTSISQIDKDMTSYKAFATGTGDAKSYDSDLSNRYGGKYPFKNILELAGGTASAQTLDHLGTHYGDWPSPGTLVVNEPGN